MRFISILAVLFYILISTNSFAQVPDDFDNSSDRETPQILAFVGKKVFLSDVPIKPDPTFNENGEEDIIVFPQKLGFEARYEVLEMVSGEYDNSIIDLIAFSSYSENHELSDMDTVLVFVDEKQGERVLGSYYFYKVNRTTDGDWATCGDSYTHNDPNLSIDEKEPLEPISFLNLGLLMFHPLFRKWMMFSRNITMTAKSLQTISELNCSLTLILKTQRLIYIFNLLFGGVKARKLFVN